jgi:hypothetical protein
MGHRLDTTLQQNHQDVDRRRTLQDRPMVVGGAVTSIRFTIDEAVCADGYTERHLLVTVVAKTGGCSGVVPGTDDYTTQVTVVDPCGHLSGYTDDSLAGLCGTATYRYPVDGACDPQWELDALPAQDGCG